MQTGTALDGLHGLLAGVRAMTRSALGGALARCSTAMPNWQRAIDESQSMIAARNSARDDIGKPIFR